MREKRTDPKEDPRLLQRETTNGRHLVLLIRADEDPKQPAEAAVAAGAAAGPPSLAAPAALAADIVADG